MRRRLAERVGDERFQRFFGSGTRLDLSDRVLTVVADDRFAADLIDRRCGRELRTLAAEFGMTVVYQVDAQERPRHAPAPQAGRPRTQTRARPRVRRRRLDDFVVGDSNRIAHAAAVRTAESTETCPPLIIHGGCGVGKTHLLDGIAERYGRLNAGAKTVVTTAETFVSGFVQAVRAGEMSSFRARFRGAALVCIDDAQVFAGKASTQQEVMHTLDQLAASGARIVLACDVPPDSAGFDRRLASRLAACLSVRISPPEAELRHRIIRHKVSERGLVLEAGACALIADAAGPSVRDLEGAIVQVEAMTRLLEPGASVDRTSVARALHLRRGMAGPSEPRNRPVAIERIIDEVCGSLRVDTGELFGQGRHRQVVLARGLIVELCRRLTNRSYPEIARAMRRPNHSSVITAHNRIRERMRAEERLELGGAIGTRSIAELADWLESRIHSPIGHG